MAKNRNTPIWDEVRGNIKGVKNEIIIMNASMVILGILMVIFPNTINGLICQGIGAVLCVWGIIRIVKYFMARAESAFGSFGLVQGGAMLGFGMFFLVNPSFFVNMIDTTLAIILLVMAIIKVQYAFDFLKLSSSRWWIQLLGAVVMAVLGILALTKPFGIANIVMILIGIGLIFSGLWDLISVIRMSAFVRDAINGVQKKSKEKKQYVDVSVEDEK